MDWYAFFMEYKTVIIFYLAVFLLIFFNRKKFDIEAKVIALYRTKLGLRLMDYLATRYREFFKLFGIVGIGFGFAGMMVTSVFLVFMVFKLIFAPSPGMGVALLIPGVKIPGSVIFVPLWYGIITIFVIATVHEFAHGVIARAHNLPVKSSGIVFFGPIIGAFVEPDEKKLLKRSDIEQYSIFAAGPFSNLVLAALVGILLLVLIPATQNFFLEPVGFSINSIEEGLPAEAAGLKPGMIITEVDGVPIVSREEFTSTLSCFEPDKPVSITANNSAYSLTPILDPRDGVGGYIGVTMINEMHLKPHLDAFFPRLAYNVIAWLIGLFKWIAWLSLAIGMVNLLPLGPVDGGRMFQIAMQKIRGDKKKGNVVWKKVSIFFVVVLVLTLILSYAINLFF